MPALNPYPNLGFNPAMGSADTLSNMVTTLTRARSAVEQAQQSLAAVAQSNSEIWRGEAGDAFREELSDSLPKRLTKAHDSISRAAQHLDRWRGDLLGFQDEARRLDAEAQSAKNTCATTRQAYDRASANPDLNLAGQSTTDAAQLANMQQRYDAAASAVQEALRQAQNANAAFDAVILRAQALQTRHDDQATATAKLLEDADDVAPHKPKKNIFEKAASAVSKAVKWAKENMGDALALVAGVVGLIALCTPAGPLAVALFAVAAATSLGAFGFHASDPELWKGLVSNPLKGDFWKSVVTLGGDVVGAVPGIGVVARTTNGVVRTVQNTRNATTLTQQLLTAKNALPAVATTVTARVAKVGDNPFSAWVGNQLAPVLSGSVTRSPGAIANNVDRTIAAGGAASASATAYAGAYGAPPETDQATTSYDGAKAAVEANPAVQGVQATLRALKLIP